MLRKHTIKSLIALLHAVGHTGRHGGISRRLGAIIHQGYERRDAAFFHQFDSDDRTASHVTADVTGIKILRAYDPVRRGNLAILTVEAELLAVLIVTPAPAEFSADPHVHLAYRHGPARWAE